ncbi:APC family permease [Nonomuraea sp. NPDC049480]|uniref:APC family permease n=1 Tax=Nonomuraea sp. NPDC049480 TaxID=3364353 RepID=UPI0037B1F4D0
MTASPPRRVLPAVTGPRFTLSAGCGRSRSPPSWRTATPPPPPGRRPFGAYVAPALVRPLAIGAVVALTVLNLYGVQRSAGVAKVIVAFVLAVLVAVIVVGLFGDSTITFFAYTPQSEAALHTPSDGVDLWGVLQGGGLLFFAFAGYARIATLGEEVRDPARTIPRAIGIALAIALVVYTLVAIGALRVLHPELLARSEAPLADLVKEGGAGWPAPVVGVGAAVAALGALPVVSVLGGLAVFAVGPIVWLVRHRNG